MTNAPQDATNQIGKRYVCESCGSEIMCVKRGEGRFHCHGVPMQLVTARPLPSSD
jgi:hypothetical protein